MKYNRYILMISFTVALLLTTSLATATSFQGLLKEFHSGSSPITDIKIKYSAGQNDFQGITTLTIDGKGPMILTSEKAGKKEAFEDKISEQGLKTLVNTMLEDKIWQIKSPKKPYIIDASIVKINIDRSSISFFEKDSLKEKETQRTTILFRAIMKTMSKGKVKY